MENLKDQYNDEPVFYCNHCLSLNIQMIEDLEYCSKCGTTVVESCHIEEWQEKYKNRYGEEFLKIKNKK